MPYIENRSVHDADAHVVETPDWLHAFADPAVRPRIPQLYLAEPRRLLAFERVELAAGESRGVTLTAEPRLLPAGDHRQFVAAAAFTSA